jgi:hypothetical protein
MNGMDEEMGLGAEMGEEYPEDEWEEEGRGANSF